MRLLTVQQELRLELLDIYPEVLGDSSKVVGWFQFDYMPSLTGPIVKSGGSLFLMDRLGDMYMAPDDWPSGCHSPVFPSLKKLVKSLSRDEFTELRMLAKTMLDAGKGPVYSQILLGRYSDAIFA